jgi:hypothetical protein
MSGVVDSAERALDGLGLMTGDMAIPKRFLFGSVLGAFIFTYLKPSLMFEASKPKPWSLMVSPDNAADATPVPWWLASAGVGVLLATFI